MLWLKLQDVNRVVTQLQLCALLVVLQGLQLMWSPVPHSQRRQHVKMLMILSIIVVGLELLA